MSELEQKLGEMMNNPQLMQQILTMAQSLGVQNQPDHPQPDSQPVSNMDPKLLQSMAGFVQQGHIDSDQQALLNALSPFLSREKVCKLERAMRAAQLAGAASSFLNAGGLKALSGR